jgi:adenosylmethionine-8-amino-7-oxononanoate aminotransferase
MLAPPYNITKEEVSVMVDAVVEGVDAGMRRSTEKT